MKLATMMVDQFKKKQLPVLSVCLLSGIMVSCATVDKNESNIVDAQPASVEQQAAQPTGEQDTSDRKKSMNADSLMSTLSAPVQEPNSKSEAMSTAEPMAEKKKQAVTKVQSGAKVKSDVSTQVKKGIAESTDKEKVIETENAAQAKADKVMTAAVKTVKKKVTGPAKPLNISHADLPSSYDIWTLRQGDTPLTQGLVISTPTWEMGKEGYMSQIWLTLMEGQIHINSSSDIAIESGRLGISIDGGKLIPFTRIAENNIGIVDGKWLDKLATSSTLDIYLGFFPGKQPTSNTFKSNTSLENLDRVVATYRKLLK